MKLVERDVDNARITESKFEWRMACVTLSSSVDIDSGVGTLFNIYGVDVMDIALLHLLICSLILYKYYALCNVYIYYHNVT